MKQIKKIDKWGFKVSESIQYAKQGPVYTSNFGAFISTVSYIIIATLFASKILVIFTGSQSKNDQQNLEINVQDIGLQSFKKMQLLPYFIISSVDSSNYGQLYPFNNTWYNYFSWNVITESKYQNQSISQNIAGDIQSMRPCLRDEFAAYGLGDTWDKYYDKNLQQSMLTCFKDLSMLQMQNNQDSQTYKSPSFILQKCTSNSNCQSDIQISQTVNNIQLELRVIQQQIDFGVYNKIPSRFVDTFLSKIILRDQKFTEYAISIQKNSIETNDNLVVPYFINYYNFFQIVSQNIPQYTTNGPIYADSQGSLKYLGIQFIYTKNSLAYSRVVYGIFNLFGDMGGIFLSLQGIFSVFAAPLNVFLFYMSFIEKLFIEKSNDHLQHKQNEKPNKQIQRDLQVKKIKFRFHEIIFIFLQQFMYIPRFFFCGEVKKKMNVYINSKKQLEREIDLKKIVQKLRSLKKIKEMIGLSKKDNFTTKFKFANNKDDNQEQKDDQMKFVNEIFPIKNEFMQFNVQTPFQNTIEQNTENQKSIDVFESIQSKRFKIHPMQLNIEEFGENKNEVPQDQIKSYRQKSNRARTKYEGGESINSKTGYQHNGFNFQIENQVKNKLSIEKFQT